MKISVDNNALKSVCDKKNITYLGLFGSQTREDAKEDSDVDILVDFKYTQSYFELAKVQQDLEEVFKKKVDLTLKNQIKESLKPYIFKDLVTLYEKR